MSEKLTLRRLAAGALRRLQRPIDYLYAQSHPGPFARGLIDLLSPVVRLMPSNDKWSLGVHAQEWMKVVHLPPVGAAPSVKRIFMLTAYRGQFSLDLPLAALLAWRGHQVTIGYFPKLGSPIKEPARDHKSAQPYLEAALARVDTASSGRVRMVNLSRFAWSSDAEVDEAMIARQSFADAVMKLGRETISANDPVDASVLARYRELGRRTQVALNAYLSPRSATFDLVLVANGATFESAHLCHVAERLGLPFNTYEKFSFRRVRLMGHGSPFLRFTDLRRLWERRHELGYSAPAIARAATAAAMRLIDERRSAGKSNWAWAYQSAPRQTTSAALEASGLADGEPFALICPNVPFDAGYFDFTTVFPSMREWLVAAVRTLLESSTMRVVVRAHPGEVLHYGGSESAHSILAAAGLVEHPRLLLIPGGDKVNTYGLMERCRFGTVFSSTTGLEMAMLGKQVVVGADVYYGGCGFTIDAGNRESYLRELRRLATSDPMISLVNHAREEAQLFHFLLHYAVQWPFPYDKPDDVIRMPPHRLAASPEIQRYLPTLDALTAVREEFESFLGTWVAAGRCRHLPESVRAAATQKGEHDE